MGIEELNLLLKSKLDSIRQLKSEVEEVNSQLYSLLESTFSMKENFNEDEGDDIQALIEELKAEGKESVLYCHQPLDALANEEGEGEPLWFTFTVYWNENDNELNEKEDESV